MKSLFGKLGASKSPRHSGKDAIESKSGITRMNAAFSKSYLEEIDVGDKETPTGKNLMAMTLDNSQLQRIRKERNTPAPRVLAPPLLPSRPASMRAKLEELSKKNGGGEEEKRPAPKPVKRAKHEEQSKKNGGGKEEKRPAPKPVERELTKQEVFLSLLRRYCEYMKFRRYVRSKKFSKQQRRLYQVIETMETERSYKFHLDFCVKKIQRPIIEKGLIPKPDVKKVFSNLENLLTISTTLLNDMDMKKKNDPNIRISQCFLGTSHFFKLYKVYINNYDTADNHVRKFIKKSSQLRRLLDDAVEDHPNHYKLSDFMILPVQRIPRYKLLIDNIIKLTPEGHHELEDLKKAAESVDEVAEFVNLARVEKMYGEVYEMLKKVLKKEDMTILDKPSRKYQEQAVCLVLATAWGVEEFFEHKILLFNDMLLFISERKKKVYFVIDFKFANIKKVAYEDEDILILEVIKLGARQEVHMFFDDDMDEWFERIRDCITDSKVKVRTAASNIGQFAFTGYTPKPGMDRKELEMELE